MERSLPAPTAFNIDATDLYSEWKHWSSAFEIYSIASDLQKKDDAVQRATMLHCLGPEVQRIFNTPPCEHKSPEEAKTALNGYFAPKRNVVAERYKFRSRTQNADESFDAHLTSLRELVKSCDFAIGTLEEEMCREVLFPNLRAETAQARRPLPGKNCENCADYRNGRTRSVIAVSRHQRKPDQDRLRARFSGITSKNFQLLPMWWNRRTCS